MSDLIATGTSEYAVGGIDSATVLVSNVSPISAKHPNGIAAGVVQIETILGSGTSLKGTNVDLVARLAASLASSGLFLLSNGSTYITDRGFTASSSTQIQIMNHTPIGKVSAFAGSSAPTNWLLCDGSAVSRTTYAKLFAVTGTTYGVGDGSSTFNIPDLRGRAVIMVDGSANRITSASTNGANADTLGGAGGSETHTLSIAEMPAHTHPATLNSTGSGGSQISPYGTPSAANATPVSSQVTTQGGGSAHSVTQPWLALNYIIFVGV